jgi:hypothetical protein
MAPPKRKAPGKPGSSSGRVTPKGTRPGDVRGRVERVRATDLGDQDPSEPRHAREASTRYTPPTPKHALESPRWVPILMWVLLGAGCLAIIVNYIGGGISNWLLIGGLLSILGGILTATQYR